MNKNILIFRHTPIDVDIKMYKYFAAECWEGNISVYAETSFKTERNVCGYKQEGKGISTYILDRSDIKFDDNFFKNNKDNIFIFYGTLLASKYKEYIRKYDLLFGIVSERDVSLFRKNLKTIIRKICPFITYFKSKFIYDNVKCFLAMGMDGVNSFRRNFRIDKSVLFDFMYNDRNDVLEPKKRKMMLLSLFMLGALIIKLKVLM